MRISILLLGLAGSFALAGHGAVLPLVFEPDAGGGFVGRHAGGTVSIGPEGVDFGAVHMRLAGAHRCARVEGLDLQPGKSFYYSGSDPGHWRTGVPQYGRVACRGAYPGVEMEFYANGQNLEYDLTLEAHADLRLVRLRFEGASRLAVEANGDLRIESRDGVLRQKKPQVWQEIGGMRRQFDASYVIAGRDVRLAASGYDPSRPLVIDPIVVYSTFYGGSGDDFPAWLTVDAAGNAYFTGYTYSADFPKVPAATSNTTKQEPSAFVAKLDPTGQHILYSVVLGGSSYDGATAIAIDPSGNAYITGATTSTDFPTRNAAQPANKGGWDAFVAKLDSSGNLVYSTYLGGGQMQPCNCSDASFGPPNPMDYGSAIAADASGNAYVAGATFSADFPVTVPTNHTPNWGEGFVTTFGPNGSFVFSMLIGGSQYDEAEAIALGSGGTIWVAGQTDSSDLPVTPGAAQSKFAGSGGHPGRTFGIGDAWVAKINPSPAAPKTIVALTYLGGTMDEYVAGIQTDAADNLYVTGSTLSADFPVTAGAYQTKFGGGSSWGDGFIVKLNPTLTSEIFGTYFGGLGEDAMGPVAVDASGRPWAVGVTTSTNLTPASLGSNPTALEAGFVGSIDLFLLELDPTGASVLYFSYLGGGWGSTPTVSANTTLGTALDGSGNVYVLSLANATGLPVGGNALQPKPLGGWDIYLLKLSFSNPVSISKVNVASGGTGIAQNTWIEIHGSGLAPTSVGPNGMTWSSAPEFASGRMPTQLAGVSAKVNGKPAYIYYVSPTQVNALTPLDSTTGSVQVTLTNGSNTSDPFAVNMQAVAPTFLLYGAGPYIAAEHADGSLLGPASMSVPGYTFTPATAGEVIEMFGAGFGLPSSALTDGSSTQVGPLPSLPRVTIGGTDATVQAAWVISPGLYQINVVVPASAVNGDNPTVATYAGASTPARASIAVVSR
jgi:uncharacterized protein (TIGR03437 family)